MKNEIILYRPNEMAEHIEVQFDNETVWLNRNQIATLFGRDVKTVGKHINNIFKEGELEKAVVVANFATTKAHGAIKGKTQTTITEHYNLDVIISVGYRVKSKQGTQFRIWATRILKDYLLKGYAINNRMNQLEDHLVSLKIKVNQIDLQVNTQLVPTQGVFFDGQVFDAYELTSKIIRSARERIILIDESTLTQLSKKEEGVKVLLLTKSESKQLILDIKKANEQYGHFELKAFVPSHDRFLIIDGEVVYHLGASLKDLGKKWFAFSKMDKNSVKEILNQIYKIA